MSPEHLIAVRNLLALGMVMSAGALLPEAVPNIPRIALQFWSRCRRLLLERRIYRNSAKKTERFWEVDMTKFEP